MKLLLIVCDNEPLTVLGTQLAKEYNWLSVVAFVYSADQLQRWKQKTAHLTNFSLILVIPSNIIVRPASDFTQSKYVLGKLQDARHASKLFNSTYIAIKKYFDGTDNVKSSDLRIIVHNGYQPTACAALYFANEHSFPIRITEIGNVPNKMIIDRRGLNTLSTFDEYKFNFEEPDLKLARLKWSKPTTHKNRDLTENKTQAFSKFSIKSLLLRNELHPVYQNGLKLIKNRISKVAIKILLYFYTERTLPQAYDLCLLQVSNDIQLHKFSKYKNIDLLGHCRGDSNATIAVKFHPAEYDLRDVRKCISFCKDNSLVIIQEDIELLIQQANKIYVNNSSTIIKCILNQKPIDIIGDSIFKDRKLSTVISYLEDYLVDYDLLKGVGDISDVYARMLK